MNVLVKMRVKAGERPRPFGGTKGWKKRVAHRLMRRWVKRMSRYD